jgi:predicted metal-dependent phosphoesterase TrpH
MHVHTDRSGMCTVPVLRRFCRESYSEPLSVYALLKHRGLDLVTVTDHDSIEAAECLRKFPDFFLSEEVSCVTPAGSDIHVGVYDITERDHSEIQRRRNDLPSLIRYLDEHNLFFAVNHVFSSLTGARAEADFALFQQHFPGVETLNGQLLPYCNREAGKLAAQWGKAVVGGSDAHTLSSLGRTYTAVRGAQSKAEFLQGLKYRRTRTLGTSGSYAQLTLAVLSIGCSLVRDGRWGFLAAPLALAVPAVTLASCLRDLLFASRWSRKLNLRDLTRQAGNGIQLSTQEDT